MQKRPELSVCICTYKRPLLLDGLLRRLQELHDIEDVAEIVVVDNDPAHSARDMLQEWQRPGRLPLTTIHLPTPNISLARNAAIRAARGEWIAMIDDDELPDKAWIRELLKTQRDFDADAVLGPVLPIYPGNAPAWIRQGGFFEHQRHPTGTPLTAQDVRTGNVLIRRSTLLQVPGPFDPEFGRIGGEDTALFKRLLANGTRMFWSDEAIVSEVLPPERTTIKWLAMRNFQIGQIWVRSGRVKKNWRSIAHSLRRVVIDGTLFIVLFLISRANAIHRLRAAARCAGILYVFLGFRYEPYGR